MQTHPCNTQTLASLALIAVALIMLGCGSANGPAPLVIERIDFSAVVDEIPLWKAAGIDSPEFEGEDVALPRGSLLRHRLSHADYPVALHLDVSPVGGGGGIAVVTRASDDVEGPLGLPRSGVAFIVWDESFLEETPFNVAVMWMQGDRMVPLVFSRFAPLRRPSTLDVYDDGQWVLFAIDGEVVAASLTPEFEPGGMERAFRGYASYPAEMLDYILPQEEMAGSDVVLAAPLMRCAPGARGRVSALTLLRHAPQKTVEERAVWETIVEESHLRLPRPVEGHVWDAATGLPLPGAVMLVDGSHRWLMADVNGHFLDTRAAPPGPGGWAFPVIHPDYSLELVRRVDAGDLNEIDVMMQSEGDGDLTLHIQRDPADGDLLLSVWLHPVGGGAPRVHSPPPPNGPMVFRRMPEGMWRAEIRFEDAQRPPVITEPFRVTGEPGQEHTINLMQ